jgi:hypothetical protein
VRFRGPAEILHRGVTSFEALMAWEEEVRGSVSCSESCSRTPYLEVDALRVWGANSAKLGRKESMPA